MLTPFGWDPTKESPTDWMAGRLSREYTLFRSRGGLARAGELPADGRIALFLEGSTRLAASSRPRWRARWKKQAFGVAGVSTHHRFLGGAGDAFESGAASGERDGDVVFQAGEYLAHGVSVAAAQDGMARGRHGSRAVGGR